MTNRVPPDWMLIKRIIRYVDSAPGGGMHRRDLADRLGMRAWGPDTRDALLVAWSQKRVDFCGDYVVRPARKSVRS
jgi:hypothetical protein